MDETTEREYAGHALAAPELGPRKLYANMSSSCLIDGKFFTLIWTPSD